MNRRSGSASASAAVRPRVQLALSPVTLKEIGALRVRLRDAEETLSAIHSGAVDGLVVLGQSGAPQIYTLKGADQPYRVLVESMNEGALTLSDRGLILYSNARMAALVGRPLERMMGHHLSYFLADRDAAALMKLLRRRTGPWRATVNLRRPGGTTPAQLSLTPLDLDGTRAFCAIATDLSDALAVSRALIQKSAGLRLVAQSAPAVLFTADSGGRVLSAAGAALNTIHGRVKALLSAPVAGGRRGATPLSFRMGAVRSGSACYDAHYAGRLWNINLERLGIGGVIGIAVDVTDERHRSETEQAASRDRIQRSFVANVSHEFRTPLAAIQGYVETLLGGALKNKKDARSFVRTIGRQSTHLGELVENMLYQSSLESGAFKPRPRPIDLGRFARGVLRELTLLASRTHVLLETSVPRGFEVYADPGHLRRVLMNVVANGIKYNRAGGKLSLSAQRMGVGVRFSATDTGIGVKASELPYIFDRFHRAKNVRQSSIKGTGLGLSVAKALIEANNGRIWAERLPGQGTRFHIQLPVSP